FASAVSYFACTSRAPGHDCAREICAPGGAACPKNQQCIDGECVAPGHASCDGHKRCPDATPVCVSDQTGKQLPCVSKKEAASIKGSDDIGVPPCTVPADCGSGKQCCTGGAIGAKLTYCQNNCDLNNTQLVCANEGDCGPVRKAFPGMKIGCQ